MVDTDSVQEVNIYSSQEPLKIDFERYKTNVIITPKFGAIEKINVYNHMYQFNEDRPKVKYFRAIEFIDEQKNHLVLERGDIPGSFNISIYQNDFLKVLLQEDYEEEYKDYEIISIE
ncbi:MAG: hypothetical protein KA974_09765 [Saprospiraceae bacterium]|nr:hypothetical protein [Saprospiraceae bacterium]